LPLGWAIFWWIVAIPFWIIGFIKIRRIIIDKPEQRLLLGLAGGYIFVLSALKIPSVTGSSSHPTGTGLSTILYGPYVTAILATIALIFQALLVAHGGKAYPLAPAAGTAFFENTPRSELSELLKRTLQGAMTRSGIDVSRFRQGSLFTRTGKAKVPGTNSYGTAREMLRFLLRMEQGLLVDEWSSRELKRLLYMTERRIRYASSPALRDAAVYVKSGSLYQCVEEAGFTCRKYQGNKLNLMNSVAVVESPANQPRLFYLVALNSNVLRKNSAVDHQTLATRIHRLLEKTHGIEKK